MVEIYAVCHSPFQILICAAHLHLTGTSVRAPSKCSSSPPAASRRHGCPVLNPVSALTPFCHDGLSESNRQIRSFVGSVSHVQFFQLISPYCTASQFALTLPWEVNSFSFSSILTGQSFWTKQNTKNSDLNNETFEFWPETRSFCI